MLNRSQRRKRGGEQANVNGSEADVKDEEMVPAQGSQDGASSGEPSAESKQKENSSQACSASDDTMGENDNANADSKGKGQAIDRQVEVKVEGSSQVKREKQSSKLTQLQRANSASTEATMSQDDATPKAASKQRRASANGGSYTSGGGGGTKPKRQTKSSVSKYRGVAVHRWTGRWEAHIWENGKQLYLGSFADEDQAARAYDKAAIKLKKEQAILNFDLSDYSADLEALAEMTKEELIRFLRRESAGFARGTSTFRGVSWRQQTGRWEARIGRLLGRKYTYLGTFTSGEAAARAYDHAAIVSRGREAITNYDISEYKDKLEAIEKATPEERRKMEEEIILRPQAVGAKQRRKRFEASTSDSQISNKSSHSNSSERPEDLAAAEQEAQDCDARKFKRIKSCPPAMLSDKIDHGGLAQRQQHQVSMKNDISINISINSSAQGRRLFNPGTTAAARVQKGKASAKVQRGGGAKAQRKGKAGQGSAQKMRAQAAAANGGNPRQPKGASAGVFQRSLTGNLTMPRNVIDPSHPGYQPGGMRYHKTMGMPSMYHPQRYTGPTFKAQPPTPIEKVDLLIGDYFSGLPDGSEYTWKQTMRDMEEGYPDSVGQMLGMTVGSHDSTTSCAMPPAGGHGGPRTSYPSSFAPHPHPGDRSGSAPGVFAHAQAMSSTAHHQFNWYQGDEDHRIFHEFADFEQAIFQEPGNIPIENVEPPSLGPALDRIESQKSSDHQHHQRGRQSGEGHASGATADENQDALGTIDNIDGTNMTKILIDLGFAGDSLFTWHT